MKQIDFVPGHFALGLTASILFVVLLVRGVGSPDLAFAQGGPAQAQSGPLEAGVNGGFHTHLMTTQQGDGLLVVIHPGSQAVATYGIDATTGAISIKSVRQISQDLRIDALNTSKPTPEEIRESLIK